MRLAALAHQQSRAFVADLGLATSASVRRAIAFGEATAADGAEVLVCVGWAAPGPDSCKEIREEALELVLARLPRADKEDGLQPLPVKAIPQVLDRLPFRKPMVVRLAFHVYVDLRAHEEVRHAPAGQLVDELLVPLCDPPGADHYHGIVVAKAQIPASALHGVV